jgi:arginine:ornithine antiporter/lysine permease
MAAKMPGSAGSSMKDLSFFALFSLIFGSIMGSGVFDIPQNVAHQAGAIAVIIHWGITAVGLLALGGAFVYITNKRPDIKSGIYGYAKYGFGNYVGFNVAWGYWLSAVLGNASYLIYIFATLGNFAAFKFFGQGSTISALIAESALIWAVHFLIIRGIKEASIVNIIITLIKIIALIAVIAVFMYGFHWTQFKANLVPEPHYGSMLEQVNSTMLVTIWDFIGIEAACIYALRAKKMPDVAKATMLGVIIVLLIDMLISVLPFGIITSHQVSNLTTPSTAGVLGVVAGPTSATLIRVAVIISVSGALLAWMMLATNILYVSAEDKTLPKFLRHMNERHVPGNALLTSSITLQIFIILAYFTQSVYLAMIQLATSLILIPYLFAALFALKLMLRGEKTNIFTFIKGGLAVIFGAWLIYAGGLKYVVLSTILYAFGIVFYVIARKEQAKKIFANWLELGLFILLLLAAIISLYLCISGKLSLY